MVELEENYIDTVISFTESNQIYIWPFINQILPLTIDFAAYGQFEILIFVFKYIKLHLKAAKVFIFPTLV